MDSNVQRRTKTAAIICAMLVLSACWFSDDPTALGPARQNTALTVAQTEEGCATFDVDLQGNAVAPTTHGVCGTLQPKITGAEFDLRAGVLRLSVVVENGGTRQVRAPIHLYAIPDSILVVEPQGLRIEPGTVALAVQRPDSVAADTSFWSYTEATLAAGHATTERTIELQANRGLKRIRVTLFASARKASSPVPAIAPDSIPSDLFTDEQLRHEGMLQYPRTIALVAFEHTASPQQRQDAIDLVGGEVVGGMPYLEEEGIYVVRLSDDGTLAPLSSALQQLNQLPAVQSAAPYMLEEDYWRKAYDDPEWRSWRVDPDLADGENWAMEAIAAPMAWGCEVGSRDVPIAVVDHGFRFAPEVVKNLGTQNIVPVPDTSSHGEGTTALIAAAGNDSTGMTGVMWRSHVDVYDRRTRAGRFSIQSTLYTIWLAAQGGARVINISSGAGADTLHMSTNADTIAMMLTMDQLRPTLARISAMPRPPLMVFAAGNANGRSAFWSGYPAFALDPVIGPNMIVVAGAMQALGGYVLSPGSSAGDLVTIAAPGTDVRTYSHGSIVPRNGTSFAAPLVTGVAGLLLSFDSRVTAPLLRRYLVEGARNGGRTAGAYPLLNAYEALRRVSAEPGEPLCGTMLYAAPNGINVERGNGALELLPMAQAPGEPYPSHGGRWILGNLGGFHYDDAAHRWNALGNEIWNMIDTVQFNGVVNGRSLRNGASLSHDADSMVFNLVTPTMQLYSCYASDGADRDPARYNHYSAFRTETRVAALSEGRRTTSGYQLSDISTPMITTCFEAFIAPYPQTEFNPYYVTYTFSFPEGDHTLHSYSGAGTHVAVAHWRDGSHYSGLALRTCRPHPGYYDSDHDGIYDDDEWFAITDRQCQYTSVTLAYENESLLVYDFATRQSRTFPFDPGTEVSGMGFSEDGRVLHVTYARRAVVFKASVDIVTDTMGDLISFGPQQLLKQQVNACAGWTDDFDVRSGNRIRTVQHPCPLNNGVTGVMPTPRPTPGSLQAGAPAATFTVPPDWRTRYAPSKPRAVHGRDIGQR